MPFDSEITPKSADLIVLEKAREILAQHHCVGWTDGHGGSCIIRAVVTALPWDRPDDFVNVRRICGHLGIGDDGATVGRWSDTHTTPEVLARFDEAISRLASA